MKSVSVGLLIVCAAIALALSGCGKGNASIKCDDTGCWLGGQVPINLPKPTPTPIPGPQLAK